MSDRRRQLKEDTRFRVLRLLEQNPNMSQRDLAEAVGISVGSAHYLLNALIEMGHIKLGNFSASEDKRRYAYILTPRGVAEKAKITKRFLARKLEEYEALKEEIEVIRGEVEAYSGVDVAPSQIDKVASNSIHRKAEP